MGGDDDIFSPVLPRDPHDRLRHPVVDLDHGLPAGRLRMPSVLIENIHPVKLGIARLDLLLGPSVDDTEVDFHHAGLHQDRHFMVLRGQTVFQRFDGALQRACDAQVHMDVPEIILKARPLLLSRLVQRVVRLPLIAQLLVPLRSAVSHKIYSCCLLSAVLITVLIIVIHFDFSLPSFI